MTSKELVSATLHGLPAPRVPTGPLAVHFCAGIAGYTLREYSSRAAALAESVIRYYERFRPDAVWVSADTWVSAEAMGARLGAADDQQPLGGVGQPAVRTVADIDRIPPPDVGRQGRYPLMLEALTRVVQALGREVCVVACFDQYPFSLAAGLMGLDTVMLKLREDPRFVEALMARCEEYALAYGRALAQAGADLLSGGDSPAGLVGPRWYENLVLPAEKRLITKLKTATGKPVSLHICGNTTACLPLMASSGADVLELDHPVDLGPACHVVGPDVGLWGNIDPVGVLLEGTPAAVRQKVRSLLESVKAAGHRRFVLSSGCTIAVQTPHGNLEALLCDQS
jgi:MtaA/CmuA family methyltransferase